MSTTLYTTFLLWGSIVLWLCCAWHAFMKSRFLLLLSFTANAWVFEQLAFSIYHAVNYTHLSPKLGSIPLAIVLGWGFLLYGVLHITSKLRLPENAFSIVDGLILVTFDMIVDPIFVLFGLWSWNIPGQFFGVPYNNFFAWFLFAVLTSYFTRKYYYSKRTTGSLLKAALAVHIFGIPLGLLWFYGLAGFHEILWWAIFAGSLCFVWHTKQKHTRITPRSIL